MTAAVLYGASRFFERRAAAIFLMAPLTLVIVMAIFPLVMSLGLAFVHWNVANPGPQALPGPGSITGAGSATTTTFTGSRSTPSSTSSSAFPSSTASGCCWPWC